MSIATATPASTGKPKFSHSVGGGENYTIVSECNVRVWYEPVYNSSEVLVVAGTNNGRKIRTPIGFRFNCEIKIHQSTRAEWLDLAEVCNWIVDEEKAVTLRPWTGHTSGEFDTVVLLDSPLPIDHVHGRKLAGWSGLLRFVGKDIDTSLPESIAAG